jgi:hypothetical protein
MIRSFFLGILLLVGACQQASAPSDAGPAKGGAFSAPQGVAASERYILVANTGFHYAGGEIAYHPGFVTLVERKTRRVVATLPTGQRNPQNIAVRGSRAFVVNGGTVKLDQQSGVARVVTGGGLDVLDLERRAVVANVALARSTKDPRIGAYGSIALAPDGKTAFVGSGTRGDVFKVRLEPSPEVLRGPDDPIVLFPTTGGVNGLTVVRPFHQGLAVLDFKTDALCLSTDLSGDLARRSCGGVGVQQKLVEGPIDVARAPDGRALVLMTIANAVYGVKVETRPFSVDKDLARTGLASNRILVHGPYAYVLNSTSATLQRVHLKTGKSELSFAVLPVKSNPYDMAITTEGGEALAWITLFGANQLAVVRLRDGKLLQLIAGEKPAADGGGADLPVVDAGADTKPDVCPEAGLPPVKGIVNAVKVTYGQGAGKGQGAMPGVIQGAPQGGGASGGSTDDVLSLGVKGELVVDFGDYDVVDGPGVDLVVFENPFLLSPYAPYAEPAHVAVSTDASTFVEFACDLTKTAGDPAKQTWPYPGCAGVHPVLAGAKQCVAADDPAISGGDGFDLATLGVKQARYVRIRDAGVATMGTDSKGFDLDAVVLINYKKR